MNVRNRDFNALLVLNPESRRVGNLRTVMREPWRVPCIIKI